MLKRKIDGTLLSTSSPKSGTRERIPWIYRRRTLADIPPSTPKSVIAGSNRKRRLVGSGVCPRIRIGIVADDRAGIVVCCLACIIRFTLSPSLALMSIGILIPWYDPIVITDCDRIRSIASGPKMSIPASRPASPWSPLVLDGRCVMLPVSVVGIGSVDVYFARVLFATCATPFSYNTGNASLIRIKTSDLRSLLLWIPSAIRLLQPSAWSSLVVPSLNVDMTWSLARKPRHQSRIRVSEKNAYIK